MDTEEGGAKFILASAKFDPGCRDLLCIHKKNLEAHAAEEMDNVKVFPNDGLVVSDNADYPATDHLFEFSASYKLDEVEKRNYCLVIEDMQYAYEPYIKYCVPHIKPLIETFRELKLPIVWTNWNRRPDDGFYGAVDRFYGPQAIDKEENPCYVYGETAHHTLDELAPKTDDEISRSIVSLHLSKFADFDEDGREILFPMLDAWGINTIVMCGAWTDDCILSTVFDAIDKYGYDVILINNGCATATIYGGKVMKILYTAAALNMSAEEVVDFLKKNPEKIEAPKAPLNGNVRFTHTKYRHDPVLQEVEALKKRIVELEAQLAVE